MDLININIVVKAIDNTGIYSVTATINPNVLLYNINVLSVRIQDCDRPKYHARIIEGLSEIMVTATDSPHRAAMVIEDLIKFMDITDQIAATKWFNLITIKLPTPKTFT